jgi:putative ABC transport system permease protein
VAGRLLLVCRLLVRDLRRRRTETVLLLLAISAATATLTLGLALNGIATRPYQQTRAATAGPDVVAAPRATGPAALAALAPLTTAPGVTGHSGPNPVAFLMLTARGKTVHAVVEGRDGTPAPVDRPAVTGGTWVRPGGVVLERTFADALGVHTGDTVSVDGHPLRVLGTAVTAARAAYPFAGWHQPGSPLIDFGGLVWVDRSDMAALAGEQPLSYTLNLKLADPAASTAFVDTSTAAIDLTTWQDIADEDGRLVERAQEAMLIGSWLLAALAVASVAGIVAGRIIGQRRRLGLLKAVGAGPAMVAVVYLAEYLVIGLAAAGTGLAVGWLAAPPLTRPGAGLIGSVGAHPPALRTVVAATALALVIAVAATLVPVVRAATTSTIHALADAASPPRRRRWRIWLSRRLPTALLIGVRINGRRPRRARLATVNTLITTTMVAAVLMFQAQDQQANLGDSELADPRNTRAFQAMLIVIVVLCVLALINAVVSTWTAVLDARQPLAVARTLGATPAQASAGLAVAQLLPAIPGVALGIPAGIELYLSVGHGQIRYPPGSWWLATALGVLLAIAALTAIPAMAAARRPVADTLQSAPT